MRNTILSVAAVLAGVITFGPSAKAGPLGGIGGGMGGGLGGGLSGGISGGLGGLSGGFNGSLDGAARLQSDQTRDPTTGRMMDAPRKGQKAARPTPSSPPPGTAKTALSQGAALTSSNRIGAMGTASIIAAPVATVAMSNAALPRQPVLVEGARFGYIADVGVIRRRQSEALIEGGVTVLSAPAADVYMDRQAEDLRRNLVGTGVEVVREGDAIALQLPSDVTFAFDKSDIRERFFPVLSAVANTLNQYPATFVDVIGHTDAVGSVGYNQALSERRAAAVADFVQRREDIPARLYVTGRGKSEPIATNATVQGRAENRRVEILLHPYTQEQWNW